MSRYGSQVSVARSAADTFAAVNDIARWGEWTEMEEVTRDQPGPIAVGSTGTFRLPGPFQGPIRFEATAFEPDRRVAYRMSHPSFEWHAEMRVEPESAGSRLSSTGEFTMRGWRRILQPVVAREVGRGEAEELKRLKAILEGGAAS